MWSENNVDNLKIKALDICKEYLGGEWKNIKVEEFRFSKVSGGLSNKLYLCELLENQKVKDHRTPREALLRIYGDAKDKNDEKYIESLIQESVLFAILAERQLGPKLYGIFTEGRLEEYIPSRILTNDEVKTMSLIIARKLAKIHALKVPTNKSPFKIYELSERWLNSLDADIDKHGDRVKPAMKELVSKGILRSEYEWLKNIICEKDYAIVFCHNDLHGGNLLLRENNRNEEYDDDSKLVLIDFEFSYYNYRSFEFASHFGEWCFEYNTKHAPNFEYHPERYPTQKEQENFVDTYLDQIEKEDALTQNVSKKEEKIRIFEEMKIFNLFVNIFVSIWAFKAFLTASDQFDFDFAVFGHLKLDMYWKLKKKFLESENDH